MTKYPTHMYEPQNVNKLIESNAALLKALEHLLSLVESMRDDAGHTYDARDKARAAIHITKKGKVA